MGVCEPLKVRTIVGLEDRLLRTNGFGSVAERHRYTYDQFREQVGADAEINELGLFRAALCAEVILPGQEEELFAKIGVDEKSIRGIHENVEGIKRAWTNPGTRSLVPETTYYGDTVMLMSKYDGSLRRALAYHSDISEDVTAQAIEWFTVEGKDTLKAKGILKAVVKGTPMMAQDFATYEIDRMRHNFERLENTGSLHIDSSLADEIRIMLSKYGNVSEICGTNVPVTRRIGYDWRLSNFLFRKVDQQKVDPQLYKFVISDIQGNTCIPAFGVGRLEYSLISSSDVPENNRKRLISPLKRAFVGRVEGGEYIELPKNKTWSPRNEKDKFCDTHALYELGIQSARLIAVRDSGRMVVKELSNSGQSKVGSV